MFVHYRIFYLFLNVIYKKKVVFLTKTCFPYSKYSTQFNLKSVKIQFYLLYIL